jgi:hypothetical protein
MFTQAVVEAICGAVARHFGTCTCTQCPEHGVHQCQGCHFLSEKDGVASRPDVLAFYRWQRRRLILEEGHVIPDASMPARPTGTTLPW